MKLTTIYKIIRPLHKVKNFYNFIYKIEEFIMKKLVIAITEEIFESWDKVKQDQWLKDHPNSKFKNLEDIKNLRNIIEEKQSVRMSDYADDWGQGNREREAEDKELKDLDEKLKRLERKPLHKVRIKKVKPVQPLTEYKLPQEGEPHFSKDLEPFTNFSKKTGIRNIEDLKRVADSLSEGYNYKNLQARQTYKNLADNLLNKYKGITVKVKNLEPSEKKLIQMLAIYKKEKLYYEENERKRKTPEYKKYQELVETAEKANRELKPLLREWYGLLGLEERTPQEKRQEISRKRAQLGKELHRQRLAVDKLYQKASAYKKANNSKFPEFFPIQEPIFGKPTIEPEKLGLSINYKDL